MNVKMEKIENNGVKLEITVDAAKFDEGIKKAFIKEGKKFAIPGFRKGKAPIGIVKKYYGEQVFYEEAINFCIDETYPKAISENELKPVDYPEIDIIEVGEGKEFVYSAKITVAPEVELGEYKGVEVKKPHYEVTDEEIELAIKEMQEKNARVETKEEGTIENGNIAVIDFKGFVDEKAFEGGEGKDFSLEIGSGTFIDNFEEQLIGLKAGDEKDVNVSFPEEYGRDELNGKQATFKVKINEIKTKEMPEIDDEFAKEISEFDTIAEVREDIKKKKEAENELREKREYEEAVIDAVCENAKMDIPQVMIKNEIDGMLKDLEMRLKYQGLDLNTYYQYTNSNEEKVREFMKETAEKRVKTDLVIGKIAKIEDLKITDEEVMEKATEMAKQYGDKDIEKTAKLIIDAQRDLIRFDVLNEKVIKMIVDNSKAIA